MKAVLYSDLHIWFGKCKPRLDHSTYDIALCAGDIGEGVSGAAWVRENVENGFYVAGNHEFYGLDLFSHYEKLKTKENLDGKQMKFLQNEVFYGETKNGEKYRILGATLWTDFMLDGAYCGGFYGSLNDRYVAGQWALNDFRQIKDLIDKRGNLYVQPETIHAEHVKSVEFIRSRLSNTFDGKTIVMTHHAPSPKSIVPGYRNSQINFMYASNLEPLIEDLQPDLWVHGHIHSSVDYNIGKTRIVTNPRGYMNGSQPENRSFDPHFIIEI